MRWFACLTMTFAVAAAQRDQPPMPLHEGAVARRDLAYVTGGHERHRLDLYLPLQGSRWPLIVIVHGGGWRGGSKEKQPVSAFLEGGFAVASINYRLSQHAIFPAQIEDCKAAVRWLRANAAKYGYDAARIGVTGSSAGGHLVAMLGTTGNVKDFDVGENLAYSSGVQAVADFFGPTDFLQMDAHRPPDAKMVHDDPGSAESQLVGGWIRERQDMVRRANPIVYIDRDDPPFLIVHGDRDRTVPHHQSVLLRDALQKAGVPVTLRTIDGGTHGGITTQQGLPEALEFFRRTLRP